jgi:acetyl-CoA acetyltransferase
MLHPILRTVVKVAVASLVVGTILGHFGITAEQLMREFGLSAERIEDFARRGIAWADRAAANKPKCWQRPR